MFPSKFRICDVFGIPVYLDISLIVLLVLFVMDFGSFTFGLACALALAVSITLHELGHALTARAFGYQTRDITLSLLGGCASLVGMPHKAWQEFLTAIAGPAVSFALSFAGIAGLWAVSAEGGFSAALQLVLSNTLGNFGIIVNWGAKLYVSENVELFAEMLGYFAVMNLVLGVFNLLPGFPMDGGRIFRSALRIFTTRVKATYAAMVVGRVFAVLLALWGVHAIFQGAWGWVKLLITWMIWREGWREYMMAVQEDRWGSPWEFSARGSPPPYDDGDDEEVEVRRRR